MFQEIERKISYLILLLPGFLSMYIIGLIVHLGQLTEFQIIFYSLALLLINLFFALLIYWLTAIIFRMKSELAKSRLFYTVLFIVSIGIGILFGFAAEKDWFFVTLRCLPITDTLSKRSSSRPLVFLLSQNSTGQLKKDGDARPEPLKKTEAWVTVHLKSGKQYEGWPEYFSIGEQSAELYISPACEWVSKRGQDVLNPVPGAGIIIFEREIETLTFIDREESKCFAHWFGPMQNSKTEK